MKDNLDIEKLFRDKFENFEGNVNPQVWSGISNAVGGTAKVAAKTGLSALTKALIIGSAAVLTTAVILTVVSKDDTKFDQAINNEDKQLVEVVVPEEIAGVAKLMEVNEAETDGNSIINTEVPDKVIDKPKDENATSPILNSDNTPNEVNGVDRKETKADPSDKGETPPPSFAEKHEENNSKKAENSVIPAPVKVAKVEETELTLAVDMDYAYSRDNALQIDFVNHTENGESVRWDFGDGNVSYDNEPTHIYDEYGSYEVKLYVTDANGKEHFTQKEVEIIAVSRLEMANIFTPHNMDGINDFYFVRSSNIKSLEFRVYAKDKKRIVYQSNDVRFRWNGIDLSGNMTEKGQYSYTVIAVGEDERLYKLNGVLTIK